MLVQPGASPFFRQSAPAPSFPTHSKTRKAYRFQNCNHLETKDFRAGKIARVSISFPLPATRRPDAIPTLFSRRSLSRTLIPPPRRRGSCAPAPERTREAAARSPRAQALP